MRRPATPERKMGNTGNRHHGYMSADVLRNYRTSSLHQNTSKLRAHYESEHLIEARAAHTHDTRQSYSDYKHTFVAALWESTEPVSDMETSTGTHKGQQDFELVKRCSEITKMCFLCHSI